MFNLKKQLLQPQNIQSPSSNVDILLKSKSCLDKLGSRIYEGKSFSKNNSTTIKCIEQVAKDIRNTIQSKIQTNFIHILNEQKRVNLQQPNLLEGKQKQQGTKKLMKDYWQKKKQSQSQARRKVMQTYKQNSLPKIKNNQNSLQSFPGSGSKPKKKAIISSLNVKMYEKQRQRQSLRKQKQQKILAYLYSYMVHVIDYKVQNDTSEFLLFQKINYTKWDQIQHILKAIQSFSRKYELKYCIIDLQKVMQLIDSKAKTQKNIKISSNNNISSNLTFTALPGFQNTTTNLFKNIYTPHQLLGCLENSQQISAKNQKKAGIRFYGNRGKLRAIIKIQAVWRGKIIYKKTKRIIQTIKKIIKVQRAYRIHLSYCKMKDTIRQNSIKKFQWFKQKQQNFRANYRINQLSKKIKYQIHICSDSQNQWQRVSNSRFLQKQNSYITRIFKAFRQNQVNQTRIIFVTARPIPYEVLNYYSKLLEIGGAKNFKNRVTYLSPEISDDLIDKIPLPRALYYCTVALKKIKTLINSQYSYIVPSTPSIDYIPLCQALDIPLYSANPQPLLYLQSNSGCKSFISQINRDNLFDNISPCSINIYSLPVLVNELTLLIQLNPNVWRWVLKIDNEHSSRGLAYFQVNKILPKKLLKFIRRMHSQFKRTQQQNLAPQIKTLTKQIFNFLYESICQGDKLTIVHKNIYRSQNQFFNFFYSNGGIIEAEISQHQIETENLCFCVQIQPDYEWKFISSYKKIAVKKHSLCCYYDSQLIEPPIQIQGVIKELIKRKLFGFFVLDFIKQSTKQSQSKRIDKMNKNQQDSSKGKLNLNKSIYFNGLKCFLDTYSSATFMRQFISKQSNVLYIPYIPHDNIKKITMTTFFHLCRLQNISFDIQRKIGNIFMFLDGLQAGCLGIMTFNDCSKMETFIHAAQVLDFFSSKIDHCISSGPPEEFILIRNSINGYLNNLRKKKLALKSTIDPKSNKNSYNSRKTESYRDKQYLN